MEHRQPTHEPHERWQPPDDVQAALAAMQAADRESQQEMWEAIEQRWPGTQDPRCE
jgi:hypothetical protein